MSNEKELGFGPFRAFFWPVHSYELKKFLPMFVIFFLIYFDYNVLRTLKDTLLVTAKESGAEVIPFVKVWVMFPGSVLMAYLFTRCSNRFSRETVFYVMISLFLAYFLVFLFLGYPYRDRLHNPQFAEYLTGILPPGGKGFVAMIRYWLFTTFYVMSELWSNIILSLLFWGFVNQITRLGEAKRFYGMLGIGANFSGYVAGELSAFFCQHEYNPNIPYGSTAWDQILLILILLVVGCGIIALFLFRWMQTQVLTDERFYTKEEEKNSELKGAMSMRENLKTLFRSKYLFCVATIVVAYNLIINLVEVLWKHQVCELYPDPSAYSMYMNHVTSSIGVIATFASFCITGNAIRRYGWTFTAMITPMILLVTSIGFFGFFFMKEPLAVLASLPYGMSPLSLTVLFGTIQNCLSRGAKYTVYDATREMALVPLDSQLKIKGKTAIDGICNRFGKSSGAVIHQGLLLIFGSLVFSAPYVAAFLLATLAVWIVAVKSLGKQFQLLTSGETITEEDLFTEGEFKKFEKQPATI